MFILLDLLGVIMPDKHQRFFLHKMVHGSSGITMHVVIWYGILNETSHANKNS